MSNETNVEAVPAPPADYFNNPQARADVFAARVAALDKAQPAAAPGAPAATPAEPNADALAALSATAQHKLADGRFAALAHSGFKATIERMRADVLSGKPWDAAAAKAELHRVLGLEPPAAPAPANKADEPIPPGEGTPEERAEKAIDGLATRLGSGEFVPVSELLEHAPAALAGYKVELPEGWGLDSHDIDMLHTAKAAGISQEQVDAFIAAKVKAAQ
jgi:hypothetical protein